MTQIKPLNDPIAQKIRTIHEEQKALTALAPEKAMDVILDAKEPAALVHAFPEEDFFFLVHDIGPYDALPLLSLANNRQWEYFLDMEVWQKDRMDGLALIRWLSLLYQAGPERFLKWCLDEKRDLIELFLFKHIEVVIRSYDEAPAELGDNFQTFDDVFYFRFIPPVSETDQLRQIHEETRQLIGIFLEHLATSDYAAYQNVLLAAMNVIPAEAEEEAFRIRNVRIAEKGFQPFHESLAIYARLSVGDLPHLQRKKIVPPESAIDFLPVPPASIFGGFPQNTFLKALSSITDDTLFRQLQLEFASLCNLIASTEKTVIREREKLNQIVLKANGYVSVGLEHIHQTYNRANRFAPQALIQTYFLSDIFRIGHTLAVDLKRQAEKWLAKSWARANQISLTFWDEEGMGILGGLLLEHPMYFDNYQTHSLYRDFTSLEDIGQTRQKTEAIYALDHLLDRFALSFEKPEDDFYTYKQLFLTLWCRDQTGLSLDFSPIPLDIFKKFYQTLWQSDPAASFDLNAARKIKTECKAGFLKFLSARSRVRVETLMRQLGQLLDDLFIEIESEFGHIQPQHLDPKFISLFWIQPMNT